MRIDAHHHLWDLQAVDYPWLMARGVPRFFGDPTPIQRDQIVGRAPEEDAVTGTYALLQNPAFAAGLREAGRRGLSFDLQLIPALYDGVARVMDAAPDVAVALCHAGSPHDRTPAGLDAWAQALTVLSGRLRPSEKYSC